MIERWVLDASGSDLFGPYAFCPIEEDGTVLTGLTMLSTDPPGELVGVVHEGGQQAVEDWCEANPAIVGRLFPVQSSEGKHG